MIRMAQVEREPLEQSQRIFYGPGVYGREGRRLGVIRSSPAGRPGGRESYAIIELSGYSSHSVDLRAVPLSTLAYDDERGHFLCELSEVCVRSAPAYKGAADWLDRRWIIRLVEHYERSFG